MTRRVFRVTALGAAGLAMAGVAFAWSGAAAIPAVVGWGACEGGGACLAKGAARIEVSEGEVDAVRGRLGGEVVHDEAITVGGRAAHLLVGFEGDQMTAVTVVDGKAVTVRAPVADAGEAAHAWTSVVERLGIEAAGDGGAIHLENVQDDCEAIVHVDGAPVTVTPGGKADATLAAGRGLVEWQERGGGLRSGVATPGATVKVGCDPAPPQAPSKLSEAVPTPVLKAPEPVAVTPVDAAPRSPEPAERDMPYGLEPAQVPYIGAAAAMVFYLELWSLAIDGKRLDAQPKSLYRLLLKTLANRPQHEWMSLGEYIPIVDALHAALDKARDDQAKHEQIERIAAILLVRTGQLTTPCAKVDDAAPREQRDDFGDCILRKVTTDAKDRVAIGLIRAAKAAPPAGALIDELKELAQ